MKKMKSYWNNELLPILLKKEKVSLYEVLVLISDKYICSTLSVAHFLDAFIYIPDTSLATDQSKLIGEYICELENFDHHKVDHQIKTETRLGVVVPFNIKHHVNGEFYEAVTKIYWDSNYFKKLLKSQDDLIQKFEENFIFLRKPIKTKIPLYFLNDTFTLIEASCLLSGDDPILINRCFYDANFNQKHSSFNEAYNFINSAISTGKLPENSISSDQLKVYFQDKGQIITGFNDELEASLQADISDENYNADKNTVELLKVENEMLRTELLKLHEEIRQWKESKQAKLLEPHELKGLAKINQLSQDRKGMARIIATSLWENDPTILMSDMANHVYARMVDYCREGLPQQPETIKSWIRPVATIQAQRKGRPSKKSNT